MRMMTVTVMRWWAGYLGSFSRHVIRICGNTLPWVYEKGVKRRSMWRYLSMRVAVVVEV